MRDDWQLLGARAGRAERAAGGEAVRVEVPLASHADLHLPPDRDPVATLRDQEVGRIPELLPLRHERMSADPFAFLRGSAAVMAADLAAGPRTPLEVQLGGDAHLANFGVFAAPDRRLVVDANDFDETLRGPFEWDVKRLAASLVVAGELRGIEAKACRRLARDATARYRELITLAATMDPLDIWHFRVEFDDVVRIARERSEGKSGRRLVDAADERVRRRAARKTHLGALSKLVEEVDGRRRLVTGDLVERLGDDRLAEEADAIAEFFDHYMASLPPDRRWLLERYRLVDVARKVVGVGSVGTACHVVLLETGDGEPLFLQLKEAGPSVLERHLGASAVPGGRRVVEGQRAVQSASDDLLGWASYRRRDGTVIDYYVRQLWDGKVSPDIDRSDLRGLRMFGRLCASVLARAHARTGDPAAIAGYLGDDDRFDRAIARWAQAAARQNVEDHATFRDATRP